MDRTFTKRETTKLDYRQSTFLIIGREIAGSVTLKHVYEIAKIKKTDKVFQNASLDNVCKSVIGSARSMGIQVVDGRKAEDTE